MRDSEAGEDEEGERDSGRLATLLVLPRLDSPVAAGSNVDTRVGFGRTGSGRVESGWVEVEYTARDGVGQNRVG